MIMTFNNNNNNDDDDDDDNTGIILDTSRLQDPTPLTENEGNKERKGSLLTSFFFFTQNFIRALTFWASEILQSEKL